MSDTAPYYLIVLLALLPSLANNKKKQSAGWYLFFALLLIFVGLRHEVGSDWSGYLQITENTGHLIFKELFNIQEFLYYFIVWSSAKLDFGIYGANVVTTWLLLVGLFKFCEIQSDRWLALTCSLPFLVIVIGMSANRQAAAIGVTLYLLAVWQSSGFTKKISLITIATLLHTSAVVTTLYFIVDSKISFLKKIVVSIFVLGAVGFILVDSPTLARYEGSYIQERGVNHAAGAIQQILLNALPGALILLLRRKLNIKIPEFSIIYSMALLSFLLIPFTFLFSVAASRISFYLFPISIACLAALPELSRSKSTKTIVKYFVWLYSLGTLALWLNFANHAHNHKPYINLLFI